MRQKNVFAVFLVAGLAAITLAAQQPSAALTGVVKSQDEGVMEGVLVSAKRAGSTITTTVVSDARISSSLMATGFFTGFPICEICRARNTRSAGGTVV